MKPNYDISVFSLRRSGSHAVVCWLANHFKEPINFVTGIEEYGAVNPTKLRVDKGANEIYHEAWVGNASVSSECYIHTYQHYAFWHPEEGARVTGYQSYGKRRVNIVLVRDPWNTYASQLKMADKGHRDWPNRRFRTYWLQHAQEFLSRGKRIGGCIPISYNEWFQSSAYRRRIEKLLKLPTSDKGLSDVPNVSGIGSSFDGITYDGDARRMPVLRRWWEYRNDNRFKLIHDDTELRETWETVNAVAVKMLRGQSG